MSNSSNIKPVLFGNNEAAMMRFATDNAAIVDRIVFESENFTVFINLGNPVTVEPIAEPEPEKVSSHIKNNPVKRVRDYAAEKARRKQKAKSKEKPANKPVQTAPAVNEAEEPESIEDEGEIVPENDFTEPAKPNVRTHAIAPQEGKRKIRTLSELGANLRLGAAHRKAH